MPHTWTGSPAPPGTSAQPEPQRVDAGANVLVLCQPLTDRRDQGLHLRLGQARRQPQPDLQLTPFPAPQFVAQDGRLVRHRLASGALLIDDSYNANPGSLAAAIDTLAAFGGERWLVLGEMGELGDDAQALHGGVGRRAREAGIERLFALGPLGKAAVDAFGDGGAHFDSHAALADALRRELHPQARVLVKGSRSSAMERIVSALLENNEGNPTHAA